MTQPTNTAPVSAAEAKLLREAWLADPQWRTAFFDGGHPGHKLAVKEWQAAGAILAAEAAKEG